MTSAGAVGSCAYISRLQRTQERHQRDRRCRPPGEPLHDTLSLEDPVPHRTTSGRGGPGGGPDPQLL